MGKMIGAAEFKAHCLRIMEEAKRSGETVDHHQARQAVHGAEAGRAGQAGAAIRLPEGLGDLAHRRSERPALDPEWEGGWEANNPPDLYR